MVPWVVLRDQLREACEWSLECYGKTKRAERVALLHSSHAAEGEINGPYQRVDSPVARVELTV